MGNNFKASYEKAFEKYLNTYISNNEHYNTNIRDDIAGWLKIDLAKCLEFVKNDTSTISKICTPLYDNKSILKSSSLEEFGDKLENLSGNDSIVKESIPEIRDIIDKKCEGKLYSTPDTSTLIDQLILYPLMIKVWGLEEVWKGYDEI